MTLIEAWRAQGCARIDPLRFGPIDALARRLPQQAGPARQLLEARLTALVEAYARDAASAGPVAAPPPPDASSVLGGLLAHIDAQARPAGTAAAPPGRFAEPAMLGEVRGVWARLRIEQQVRESQQALPDDAGPLNSGVLVHRAIALMRETSPGYLEHFLGYADALAGLEQLQPAPGRAPEPVRADGTKKPARPRTRKRRD